MVPVHLSAVITVAAMMVLGAPSVQSAPNILLFMADDLGIGDIGCFGNKTLRTPNMDRLAREGARLTHHMSASSICTPSRAAFLTGRYPIRSGMSPLHTRMPVFLFLASSSGLPENETTFAELSKKAGYSTALIGKWHQGLHCRTLGDNCHHPMKQGFDYFYGIPMTNLKDFGGEGDSLFSSRYPHGRQLIWTSAILVIMTTFFLHRRRVIGHGLLVILLFLTISISGFILRYVVDLTRLDSLLIRNYEVVEQPIRLATLTRRFVLEGEEFLEKRKEDGKPFLLFLAWSHVHTFIRTANEFAGKSKHGRYGDAVEELDWGVGKILDAVDRLGFTNNTMVYLTSDNGGHLEEHIQGKLEGGWNRFYRGGKTHGAQDGGIRVPSIIRWPNVIPAGISSDEPTSLMDIFPTISNMIDVPLPDDRVIDGKDILPMLTKKNGISSHEYLFHYFGTTVHAIRYRPRKGTAIYKLVLARPNYITGEERCLYVCSCKDIRVLNNPELYNVAKDPEEVNQLDYSVDSKYKTIVDGMKEALQVHAENIDKVPYQFKLPHTLWHPWLQPCCNFPYCDCDDPKFSEQFD